MTNTQRAKLDTCNRIHDFNEKYKDDLKTNDEYAAEQKDFDDALININTAIQLQDADTGKPADTADTAKNEMADTIIKFALRGLVKAKQAKNNTLANQLDHPVTYLSQAPKTTAVLRAQNLVVVIKDNLATLTNIKANDVLDMDKTITTYNDIKDTAVEDIQHKAAAGTSPLPGFFTTAFAAIDNMYDLVRSYFSDVADKKSLVEEMALAKQIILTGIHHTGITGDVMIKGEPVEGATITVEGSKKSARTDAEGHYTLSRIRNGKHPVTVTLPDGKKITKMVDIIRGHMEVVDFEG